MPHIHEKIDFTVEVFIVFKDKVLLRLHDKYGKWLSVGGHIELDEDPNQAAVREPKEEVGLDVALFDNRAFTSSEEHFVELISPISMNRHRISPAHEHVTLVYFATSDSDKVVPENVNDQWKWCSLEELDNLKGLQANVAFYARKALQELAW